MSRIIRFLVLFAVVMLAPLATAQETSDAQVAAVEGLRKQADEIAAKVEEVADNDADLVELAIRADELEEQLVALGVELSPRLGQITTRLDQLGPPPAEGEPVEPESIRKERKLLAEERAQINQLLGVLEDQSIRAKNILDRISETRRELFTGSLSRRYDIGDAFSSELFTDLGERTSNLESRLSSWSSFTWRFKQQSVLAGAAGIIILMLVAVWGSRRSFGDSIYRDPDAHEPSYFQRLTTAFWYTILPSVTFWLLLALSFWLLSSLGVLRADIAEILRTLLISIGIVFLVWRLAEGVFAPSLPNWRLFEISNLSARPLKIFVILMVLVSTVDVVITQINSIIGTSVPVTIAKSLVTSIAVGVLLLIIAFLRPFLSSAEQASGAGKPWPTSIKVVLCVVGGGLILTALSGYIGLARFAAQQIVVTGAIFSTMYLGYRTAQAISADHALHETRLGQRLINELGVSEVNVDRLGLVAGIALTLLVLTLGIPVLALAWGFQWADVQRFFVRFFTDIQIGSISISITSILVGIALFIVGLLVTRRFQQWLDGKVLARSGVESGARNSISAVTGYIGVAIAGLLGVSAAGLELSQLALVAGALSLGIGFGLQNIVSNFVSGLILLAERPFKAGDIIEAGGFTGVVKNVKVRATEIETFDKKTLVLPNSELINSAVVNWVHKTTLGRVEVGVGVAYDSDPQFVHDLLLEIANDHPRLLANPEPFVEFANFGDSSLDFIVRGFLADIGFGLAVRTELRIAIFERFKAAGIEIPFPQRDINLSISDGEVKQVIKNIPADGFDVIKTGNKRSMDEEDG